MFLGGSRANTRAPAVRDTHADVLWLGDIRLLLCLGVNCLAGYGCCRPGLVRCLLRAPSLRLSCLHNLPGFAQLVASLAQLLGAV